MAADFSVPRYEGRMAWLAGRRYETNPYPESSRQAEEWALGWLGVDTEYQVKLVNARALDAAAFADPTVDLRAVGKLIARLEVILRRRGSEVPT